MQEINIKGKSFTKEEVCAYGKKSISKTRKVLLIIGLSFIAVCVLVLFADLFYVIVAFTGTLVDSETGEIITIADALHTVLVVTITEFSTFGVAGIVLIVLSFIKAKKDPFPVGVKYLNKRFPYPMGFDGKIAQLLQGDKHIQFSRKPDIALIVSSKEHKLQIRNNKRYSRIFDKSEVLDYEIRVDNEVLVTSKSQTNRGLGKAIVGGVLFGGAGAIRPPNCSVTAFCIGSDFERPIFFC